MVENLGKVEDSKNEKILVVDDCLTSRYVLRGILEQKGYNVEEAVDGLECVAKVIRSVQGYIAILMDINMPVMNGIKATQILRGKINKEGVKEGLYEGLIIGTGGSEGDREPSLEAGMDHFLFKPINPDDLLELIKNQK